MWKLQPKTIAILCAAALVTACGKDEPGIDPDNGSGSDKPPVIDPNEQVADPDGTVTISMRNENSGKTMLNDMYIDKADNFNGSNGWQFVNLGAMKGLGNVSYIPKSGYADKVSVTPGNGYVAVRPANTYWGIKGGLYRMYVTGYTLDIAGQIIGAEVKYQEPFKGLDEPLRADETALTFTNEGGSQSIVLNNATIIPFTIQSSATWCRAVPSSTTDHSFLHDAVTIEVESTSVTTTDEAIVTLTTGYKKELSIKVTRAGRDPFLTLNTNSSEITFYDQTINVGVSTNIPSDQLTVTSDADWCTASFTDNVVRMRDKAAKIKYIDGKSATASRSYDEGISSLNLTISATKNLSETQRTATITVASGEITSTYTLTQNGTGINIQGLTDNTITISAEPITTNVAVWCALNLDELEVTSDGEWLKAEMKSDYRNENYIALTPSSNDNTLSRQAKVTVFSVTGDLSASFVVNQEAGTLEFATDEESISVTPEAGTKTIPLNTTVLPSNLKVESSADWCTATIDGKSVTLEYTENPTSTPRNADITISAIEGALTAKIPVTQEDGYIKLNEESWKLDAQQANRIIEIETNVDVSTIITTCSAEWCDAKVINGRLAISVDVNKTLDSRNTTVTVMTPDKRISTMLNVEQDGAIFKVGFMELVSGEPYKIYVDRKKQTLKYEVTTTLDWAAESLASWCTIYVMGNELNIMIDDATETRSGVIKIKGTPFEIEIVQHKYAVGDSYNEGGVIGTVGYMLGTTNLVYQELATNTWASNLASNISTGATSRNDGKSNMEVIKKIPNWRELYPAFAACDDLNINGVTGWYLPAIDELLWMSYNFRTINTSYLTSTEISSSDNASLYNHTVGWYGTFQQDESVMSKNRVGNVIAVHRF